jgi:hypothetical protein
VVLEPVVMAAVVVVPSWLVPVVPVVPPAPVALEPPEAVVEAFPGLLEVFPQPEKPVLTKLPATQNQ